MSTCPVCFKIHSVQYTDDEALFRFQTLQRIREKAAANLSYSVGECCAAPQKRELLEKIVALDSLVYEIVEQKTPPK